MVQRLSRAEISLLVLLVGLHGTAFPAASDPATPPFQPGEQLTYSLRWKFLNAGSDVFTVLPVEAIQGVRAYHFTVTVRSSPFLDVFYKVRDRVESYADIDMTHSLLYKNEQREGGYSRDVIVTFDWEKETAQFENRGEKQDPIFVYPGTFDPLGITYYLRTQTLVPGSTLRAPVTDGKRLHIGTLKVIERQELRVPAGRFETFLVEPVVTNLGGVFKRSAASNVQIWLSADARRVPLKVSGKARLGSFSAVLVSAEYVSR